MGCGGKKNPESILIFKQGKIKFKKWSKHINFLLSPEFLSSLVFTKFVIIVLLLFLFLF